MTAATATAVTLELEPADNERLANLCGQMDEHLRLIERRLGVSIAARGNIFSIEGETDAVSAGRRVVRKLYRQAEREVLTPALINLQLQQAGLDEDDAAADTEVSIHTRRGLIRGRGPNQKRYLERIASHDVNFGVGPAGTGKTFLAVACAVDALEKDRVQRIVLVRPAVEAGERLGFLPGDLAQKVDPYLRPLHDALFEMVGFERAARLTERNVIEVAPLAYMRGRTLNDAFVILDEAQNTTSEQMKMFLTRIGFGSKAVITGDMTQIDLPPKITSGLRQAIGLLKDVEGVSQTFFDSRDVVRHPIVRRIVEAYEQADAESAEGKA
jgi:phosphate starvation-inducible protein PhoH and related proteins